MTVDDRRFHYALEPLRRQRQWGLDALQAQLGRIQREIEQAELSLADVRAEHARESELAARAAGERLDPGSYARLLRWLSQLSCTIHRREQALTELRSSRTQVSAECLAQQRKVDVVERHRDECRAEFVREEQGRLSAEADRDWLSRRCWANAHGDVARSGKVAP